MAKPKASALARQIAVTKKIDVPKALRLRVTQGLSYDEIGQVFNATGQAVRVALSKFLDIADNPEDLQAYREHKSTVFETVEHALLKRLLVETANKRVSIGDLARALDVVGKHVRLLQGQSTENIGLLVKTLQAVHSDVDKALDPSKDKPKEPALDSESSSDSTNTTGYSVEVVSEGVQPVSSPPSS
jgi:hypothetical protein